MPNRQTAYAIAAELYQELHAIQGTYPEVSTAIDLADKLAIEMAWRWSNSDD